MNIKHSKSKDITAEELYYFNVDNEEIEIVKDFVHRGSVIKPNEDCSQEDRELGGQL